MGEPQAFFLLKRQNGQDHVRTARSQCTFFGQTARVPFLTAHQGQLIFSVLTGEVCLCGTGHTSQSGKSAEGIAC